MRKLLIGREDPCRCIAELVMGKEKLELHETAKWDFWALPCPEEMALCLSQGGPSLFSVSCHHALSWILSPVHSGFALWMLWSSVLTSSSVRWSLRAVPVAGDPQGAAVQVLCWATPAALQWEQGEENTQGRGSQKRKREAPNGETAAVICV